MGSLENFNFSGRKLIETGTGEGWSVYFALKNGAPEVWTVEECFGVYLTCLANFADDPRVHLNWGLSTDFLRKLNEFNNSLIFLDAHFAGGADYGKNKFAESVKLENSFPLIGELNVLADKDIRTAIIVIDDARIYYSDCPSECPELLRKWDSLPELEATLDKFTGHTRHLIGDEQGYVVLLPSGTELGEVYKPLQAAKNKSNIN